MAASLEAQRALITRLTEDALAIADAIGDTVVSCHLAAALAAETSPARSPSDLQALFGVVPDDA